MATLQKKCHPVDIPSLLLGLTGKSLDLMKFDDESHLIDRWLGHPSQYKLLYRASEHHFDTNEYHKLCDGIPNLLVLVRTQFNKTIGAYTPLSFDKGGVGYKTDRSRKSFLFSLSLEDIYPLQNPSSAIY